MSWRIAFDHMVHETDDRSFALVQHGLDRIYASETAQTARVVVGKFPDAVEITGNCEAIRTALSEVSHTGEHFTTFASLYQAETETVLLLDYIH
ncbi:MAG TPA: hypothetical protein VGP24_09515 [Glaciihabitans sp.]|jgi:hypothetical protein|nr:hypothetical protein [Glaciihabitans sp.]